MVNSNQNNRLELFRKTFTILIISLIFISLQDLILFKPAVGDVEEDSEGNLTIDGGWNHTIDMKGGPYQMQGNITIDGPGSTLIIRNTTLKFLKGSGFNYHIEVKNSGTLLVENSEITVDESAGGTEERTNIMITSGFFEMHNSTMLLPGSLEASSSSVTINTSLFKHNSKGSVKSSLVMNFTDSNVLIMDSTIKDLEGGKHIYLRGTTDFTAINTYLNLSSLYKLKLYDNATAKLYSLEVESKTDNSVIDVQSSYANAEIYRLMNIQLYDATGIPVGGAKVTSRNYSNQAQAPPPGQNILAYLGKQADNYNITDYLGKVVLPLLSDNISTSGIDYSGNYLFNIDLSTYSTSGAYSLKPYPNFYEEYNNPAKTFTFSSLIPPDINDHYSNDRMVKIDTKRVFNSPLQLQENLIIDGATLTVSATSLGINQSETDRFYILLKNGAKLELINADLSDPGGWPLNIYVSGASQVLVRTSNFGLAGGIVSLRGASRLEMNSSTMTGTINSIGPGNKIKITESTTVKATKMVLEKTEVIFRDLTITANSYHLEQVQFTAVNTTFNKQLAFKSGSVANLTNVTFSGVPSPAITIADTSTVNIYWWLTVRVVDGGDNLLENANVHLYNYTLSGQKVHYSTQKTDVSGSAIFEVYSEKRNASGSYKGIERNYFLNATYRTVKSNGLGTLPLTANKVMELEFELAADLLITGPVITGNAFAGNIILINATVKNVGDFDMNTTAIPVRFYVNGKVIGSDSLINKLIVDEEVVVSKEWMAVYGSHIINVSVDPANIIGEKNESNNKVTSILPIPVYGPDLGVSAGDITFDPEVPVKDSNMTISVKITNHGGYDPADNGDSITVRFYVNDPTLSGTQIGSTQVIYSIPPTTTQTVSINYTVWEVRNYNIFVVVETAYDSNPSNNKANKTLTVYTLPDLYISSSDITILPVGKVIQEAPVYIRAVVHNIGGTAVDNVGVAFYDREPAEGVDPIGFNTSIETIQPNGGTVTAQILWSFSDVGTYKIFVYADPEGLLTEAKVSNNIANKTLEVLSKPNLRVEQTEIQFSSNPVMEGEPLDIQVLIHNDGEVLVQHVLVRVTMNSLINPPIVEDMEIPSIAPNGYTNLQIKWPSAQPNGTHSIYIWVDPDNTIPESNNLDNHAFKSITITKTIDLRVDITDIYLAGISVDGSVDFGKDLDITVKIWNDGGSPTNTEFYVQFFISGAAGKTQLGTDQKVSEILPGNYAEISAKWYANASGMHEIQVIVDPNKLIMDSNRANNDAIKQFNVLGPPDIAVELDEDMFSTGEYVKSGTSISISAIVQNRGETGWGVIEIFFYDGDPRDTQNKSEQIGSTITHDYLQPYSPPTIINTSWDAEGEGVHDIYVFIDYLEKIPEQDRTNNVAYATLEVLSKAPDLKITDIDPADADVLENVNVDIEISVLNLGNADAEHVVVGMYVDDTEDLIYSIQNITILPMNFPTKLQFTWEGDSAGNYQIYFVADPFNDHKEFNERNNENYMNITVKREILGPDLELNPDVSIPLIVSPLEPMVGEPITITVNIKNSGDTIATDIVVSLNDGTRELTRIGPFELGIGKTTIKDLSWTPSEKGTYQLSINLDAEDSITESNETNNIYFIDVEVKGKSESSGEEVNAMFGAAIAALVIIVILVALVLLLVIRKRRITEWAECSECAAKMPLNAEVCPSCGAEFSDEMECGECHTLISIDDTTCPNCGAVFVEEPRDEKKKRPLLTLSESQADGSSPEAVPDGSSSNIEGSPETGVGDEKEGPEVKDATEVKKEEVKVAKPDESPELLDEEEFQEFEKQLDSEIIDDLDIRKIPSKAGNPSDLKLSLDDDDSELSKSSEKSEGTKTNKKKKKLKNSNNLEEDSDLELDDDLESDDDDREDMDDLDKDEDIDDTEEDEKEDESKEDEETEEEDIGEKDEFVIPDAQWTAECYKCNARIPLSASVCPECGAEFE